MPSLSAQLLWMILGAVFGAGVVYTTVRLTIAKTQSDVSNVARIGRDHYLQQEQRWKHMIANDIEKLEPKADAHRVANLLREDAWRK